MNANTKRIAYSYLLLLLVGVIVLTVNLMFSRWLEHVSPKDMRDSTLIALTISFIFYTGYLAKNKWIAAPRKLLGTVSSVASFERAIQLLDTAFEVVKTDEQRRTVRLIDRELKRNAELQWRPLKNDLHSNESDVPRKMDGYPSKHSIQLTVSCRYAHVVDVGAKNAQVFEKIEHLLEGDV